VATMSDDTVCSFFGTAVNSGGKGTPIKVRPGNLLLLKQAALAKPATASTRVTLVVQCGGKELVVCSLTQSCEQVCIDLAFGPTNNATLMLKGSANCVVHICGFEMPRVSYRPGAAVMDDDDDDDDDDEEEEEEAPAPAPAPAGKKRPAGTPTPAPGKAAKGSAAATPGSAKKVAASTPAKAAAATPKATPGTAGSSASATGAGWTPKEDDALRKACAQIGAEVPNRWDKVAAKVGGGKTKDACKKHFKDLSK